MSILSRMAAARPSSDPFFISSHTRRFSSTVRLRHLDSICFIRSYKARAVVRVRTPGALMHGHISTPQEYQSKTTFLTYISHQINGGIVGVHDATLDQALTNFNKLHKAERDKVKRQQASCRARQCTRN